MKKEVIEALGNWIVYVTNQKGTATSAEVEALPKVAEVFLNNYSRIEFKKDLLSSKSIAENVLPEIKK